VEANSTGGHGSLRAAVPSDDDDESIYLFMYLFFDKA
jgi:hypothetical protein